MYNTKNVLFTKAAAIKDILCWLCPPILYLPTTVVVSVDAEEQGVEKEGLELLLRFFHCCEAVT